MLKNVLLSYRVTGIRLILSSVVLLIITILLSVYTAIEAKADLQPQVIPPMTTNPSAGPGPSLGLGLSATVVAAEGSSQISGLSWDTDPVKLTFSASDRTATATLKGKLTRTDSIRFRVKGATAKFKWLPVTQPGTIPFEARITLEQEITPFTLMVIAKGTNATESESKVIIIPQWKNLIKTSGRRNVITVALGVSRPEYTETYGTGTLTRSSSQISLVAKVAYNYLLAPPKWDLGISGMVTALPLTSTATGVSNPNQEMKFLTANIRLGYSPPFIKEPWKFSILGGFFWETTFGTNGALGFQNQAGPQIFPTIRKVFSSGTAGFVYAKYAPITKDGFIQFLGPDSRELAFGLGWVRPFMRKYTLSISFDYSNLFINFPVQVKTSDAGIIQTQANIQLTSYTLSVGMGF